MTLFCDFFLHSEKTLYLCAVLCALCLSGTSCAYNNFYADKTQDLLTTNFFNTNDQSLRGCFHPNSRFV